MTASLKTVTASKVDLNGSDRSRTACSFNVRARKNSIANTAAIRERTAKNPFDIEVS
jgi:hypothetical protein